MANRFYTAPKNVAIQLYNLKNKYECVNYEISTRGLIWIQKVRPSNLSREYTITVKYTRNIPEVYLYSQGIIKEKDKKIPHCYKQEYINKNNELVKICLYYPKYHEWTPNMLLSETIIPWAIEWLYFYENWRITDKWLGGGIEHEKS